MGRPSKDFNPRSFLVQLGLPTQHLRGTKSLRHRVRQVSLRPPEGEQSNIAGRLGVACHDQNFAAAEHHSWLVVISSRRCQLADQQGKRRSALPSPAAVAIGRSDFESNCAACHPSASGQNGYGPGLFGVVGRRSGTATAHVYSPSYVEAGAKGVTWTESNLFRFLADPTAFLTQKTGHPAITRMIGGFSG